jgi:subtilase family serine protease
MNRKNRLGFRPVVDRLDERWLPSTMAPLSGNITATYFGHNSIPLASQLPLATQILVPSQVRQAYGLNATTTNGAGQTIAIVDAFHDPYIQSDVNSFDTLFQLPGTTLAVVNLAGGATNDGWAGEESLDVEWAHALAPAAKIVVVEAASDSIGSLMAAVNVARNVPGISVVSMSWGSNEFFGQTSYDPLFTTPAGHAGITFLAATGDGSALGGMQYPASSPFVVSVGGSSLSATASGAVLGESGWSWGGGGVSAFEPEPGYQAGVQSTGARTTPDVSANAGTPVAVYSTAPSTGIGGFQLLQGTSIATPMFAAIIANADEALSVSGLATLDSGSGTAQLRLYQTQVTGGFRDIISGNNGYAAQSGYDLVTGLGTPNSPVLIASLVGSGMTPSAYPSFTAPAIHTSASTRSSHRRRVRRHDSAQPRSPASSIRRPSISAAAQSPSAPGPPSAARAPSPLAPSAPSLGLSNDPVIPLAPNASSARSSNGVSRVDGGLMRQGGMLELLIELWGVDGVGST